MGKKKKKETGLDTNIYIKLQLLISLTSSIVLGQPLQI